MTDNEFEAVVNEVYRLKMEQVFDEYIAEFQRRGRQDIVAELKRIKPEELQNLPHISI